MKQCDKVKIKLDFFKRFNYLFSRIESMRIKVKNLSWHQLRKIKLSSVSK